MLITKKEKITKLTSNITTFLKMLTTNFKLKTATIVKDNKYKNLLCRD